MLDKSAFKSRFAAESSKINFEMRKRTNPLKPLDEKRPHHSRKMKKQNFAPAQSEQSAKHCKKHEAEMSKQNAVR